MREWYKYAIDRLPPPVRVDLVTMTAEREELYRHAPSTGEPIPVGNLPVSVDDGILEDEEIAWVVRRLRLNHSGCPSRIRAEHLHHCLIAATRYILPDAPNWMDVVAIVKAYLPDGTLEE